MLKIYFVRHGLTLNNVNRLFNGNISNVGLLPEGITGAKKVGEKLNEIKFNVIYSSPQMRARQTADEIAAKNQYNLKIIETDLLKEMGFGDWDGKSIMERKDHPQLLNLVKYPQKYDPTEFNGETYQSLIKRIIEFSKELYRDNKEGNVLVVSHGVTITSMIKTLLDVPLEKLREDGHVDNTSISMLSTEDGKNFKLEMWNNTDFL